MVIGPDAKRWSRFFVVMTAVILVPLVLLVLVALGVKPSPANFTLTAQSGILRLQTYCAQRLVWDLPPGIVSQPGALMPSDETENLPGEALQPAQNVSLAMEGNLLVSLSRAPQGNLLLVLQRGDGADSSRPMGTVTSGEESQAIERKLYYQSAGVAPAFTLPLWGRVTVGDDVPQGSGSVAGAAPLLRAANIRARVKMNRGVNQGVPRKTIIDESLDAGDIVDTHPEMLGGEPDPQALRNLCNQQQDNWAAVGFVAPHVDSGLLDVVVHRNTTAISVARGSSTPFELSVPKWNVWILKPGVQITAAFMAVLFGVFAVADNFWASLPFWKRLAAFVKGGNDK